MALFKILKGQEKNLPANKTEGWAYVTTDEGNMYVDVSASKRVRIGAHADKADVATKAEGDTESIRAKYLAKLKQVTSNGTTFTFRGETGDGSDAADLITIPLAGDKAGLISNAAQTIKGNKTFANGISFPTIGTWPTPANETYPIKSQGLSWSGSSDNAAIFYEVQASDKGMLVIESGDDTNAGLEIRNAASKKKVTIIDGRFIGDLTGTADYADKAKGDSTSIRTTYIHKLKQVTSNGTTFTFRGEYGDGSNANDLITIPNASASVAGLITNAVQTLGGNKTFTGDIYISHGTTATMTYNTTNPKLVFSENGGQPVGIVYTDYNSYRSPAGLKVMSTVSNNGKAWFEVEGSLYVGGDIYDKQSNILLATKYVAQLVGSQGNTNYTITPQNQNGTNLTNVLNVPINLVGSANTDSKIFLVGTTGQSATAQTGYSHDTVYIDTDGFLYDSGNKPSYHSRVSIGNTNNYKWHRIARTNEIKSSWHDGTILLYISQNYNGGSYGLLRVSLRTNNISSGPNAYVEGEWIARSGFALSNFKLALYSAANKVYADIYYISPGSYAGITVKQIQQGSRGSLTQNGWFLTNSYEANDTTASDKKASTSYKDITAAQTGLRGGVAYTSVQDTVDDSRVNNANYADRAQYDWNGNDIRKKYIATLAVKTTNGTTFTFKGSSMGGDELSAITIPVASASVAGLITNAAQTIAGTKTLQGNMVIKPGTLSNYQEGLRICNADNGWTTLILGGTATSGTSASSWSLHTNGGNFYLTHNGSSSSSTGILQSDTNGNWQIKNKLGVNGQNVGYHFYVNGSSYFNGTVEVQGITTHHSNIQLDNTVRIRRNGRSVSWNQANTCAMMTMDTAEGWSPFIAQKVTNGWWTIGQYNTSGFANDWLFGYLADGNVSGISGAQNTLSTTVRLINVGGDRMFVTSANRTQHGSNVKPVYVSNTGQVTACTYELKSTIEGGSANRLPYYNAANKIGPTTHYANTTQIGINENNVAKIGSYSLYVNGPTFIQSSTANSTTDGLIVNNGRINVTNYGYTLRIGNANNAYTHFETTCSQFYFNKQIVVNGHLFPYTNNSNYNGTSSNYWNRTYSQWIVANAAGSSTDGGITLYGNRDTNYGIFFRSTGNMGTHGSVTADRATYFTMSNTAGRGWVFRNTGAGNVASISAQGHMTVNGSICINGTNVGYKLYVNGGESWVHGKLWTGDVVPESNNSKVCGDGNYYWSSMSTRWLHANRGSSSTDGGITLYSTSDTYGIMFRGTSNMGTHGWVTSDWATYFTMNNQDNRGWVFRRHNSKNVFSIDTNGFVWADGSLRANAIGKDGFMTFPRGGQYRTTTSTVTGYLRIQLPVYRCSTMIKFIVDIYNYSDNTSVSYAISGHNYSDGVWHSCTAECLSHHGQDKQNLTVAFGEMNSKSAVMIGSSSTTWSYPQVQIRDIVIGYSNWNYKYWNNADWVIDFSTSPIGNVSRSYSGTDNIKVSRGQFDQLVVINDASNNSYDALAYFRNYSNSDWSVVIDKNNAYDWGLDIRTSTNATAGLRTNGQLIVNSTCGSYREGIRLKGADGTWNTIILGATADSGTNANAWSIHRKNDNNFCISRNSSDGLNGLVMTSTGMGLGTTSPGYRLHVNGKGCFENRIYAHEWIEFNGDRGLYWPSGGYHFYPCTGTSYGSFGLRGTRGGYHGLTIGYDNNFMTVMDDGVNKGLYQTSQGMWILYYNRDSKRLGLRTSSLSGYAVTCEGDFYCRNGWLRTNGATGWYNESYGGGMYMTDSTYVKTYNSKAIHTANTNYYAFNSAGGYYSSWNNSYELNATNTLTSSFGTFNKPNLGVNHNTVQPILTWCNTVNNYGYMTRYSISSIRPTNDAWGRMRLAVGNNDGGTSIGAYLDIDGDGWIQASPKFGVNGVNTSYNFYVNGSSYFNGALTFAANDSYGIFTASNNYCSIGTSSKNFYRSYIYNMYSRSIYSDTTAANNFGYYLRANGVQYGRWYVNQVGTAGDGTNTGTVGVAMLMLGNSTAQTATSGSGANNAKGCIRLYGSNAYYTDIQTYSNGNRTFWIPNYAGTMYAVHAANNNAVGNATTPVYIAANGRVTACTSYTSALDGRYVNVTGDTMTGVLRLGAPYQATASSRFTSAALEIREAGRVGSAQSDIGYAPRIGFHWSGRIAGSLVFHSNGAFYFRNQADTGQAPVYASTFYGALSGNATSATTATQLSSNDKMTYGWNGLNYFNKSMSASNAAGANNSPTADWYHIIRMNHGNSSGYYCDIATCFHNNNMYLKRVAGGSSSGWLHIWVQGNSVTGAVWNDYAECRKADSKEPGYVMFENGDDSLSKTIERLQHFAGIVSDTWGFSQGETEEAKTNIAVAGRVLAYPYRDRNEYKPGDCVCAAPGGKVDIMTREEVAQYPDRIVGTVSCVPDYEEWGGGELADRDPVKVNGRIWIKVR